MTEQKYTLTRHEEGDYIDQNGVSWDSPKDWFWMGVLGACGCGSSDELSDLAVSVLNTFALPHDQRTLRVYDNLAAEVVAHWIDSKDLIEHGTGIGGSWLTDLGKEVHATIKGLTERMNPL